MIAELHAAQFAEDDVDSISNPTKENTGAQLHAPDEGNDDGRFGEGTGSGKEGGAESKFSDSKDEGNEEIHCDEGSPQRKKSTAMSVVEEEELQTISEKKNSAAEVSREGNEHRAGKKGGKNPTYTTSEVVAEVSNRGDRYDGPESGKRSRSGMLDDGGAEDEDAVEVAGSNLPKHAIPQTEGAMPSRKRGRPSKIPVSDNTGKTTAECTSSGKAEAVEW